LNSFQYDLTHGDVVNIWNNEVVVVEVIEVVVVKVVIVQVVAVVVSCGIICAILRNNLNDEISLYDKK
jgi:hypothetical protein